MKKRIKILIKGIFIILCLININVIIDRDKELKMSLTTIFRSALAEGEDPPYYYTYICSDCIFPNGQPGVYYECPLVTFPDECFSTACYYGTCG